MAKYATAVRTARAEDVRAAVVGGSMLVCKGTPALAVPAAGDILTQHALAGTVGAIASGTWTIPQADLGADAVADNTGDPTYLLFLDSGGVPIAMYPSSEVAVTVTPAPGDTQIVAGRNVVINSVTIVEGGA